MSKIKRKPTVLQALFPILAMLIILGVGIAFLGLFWQQWYQECRQFSLDIRMMI